MSLDTSQWTFGVDISQAQGILDFAALKSAGVKWVIMKATEGLGYIDPTFYRNWQEAEKHGIRRGAYHFAHAGEDPVKQARFNHEVVGHLSRTDMSTVLDYEPNPSSLSSKAHCLWADGFMDESERLTGRRNTLYTGAFVMGDYVMQDLSERPLWLAQYTDTVRWLPKNWTKWTMWQCSGDGAKYRLPGFNVDIDRDWFQGNEAMLDASIVGSYLHSPVFPLETVRGVQRALQQLGFNPGKIDNVYTASGNTAGAIRDFESSIGVDIKGIISDNLRSSLQDSLIALDGQAPSTDLSYFADPHPVELVTVRDVMCSIFGYDFSGNGMCAGECKEAA